MAVMNETSTCCDVVANCRKSLGMHSNAIPDSAITASSSYDSASVGPSNGRSVLKISFTTQHGNRKRNKNLTDRLKLFILYSTIMKLKYISGPNLSFFAQGYTVNFRTEVESSTSGSGVRYVTNASCCNVEFAAIAILVL